MPVGARAGSELPEHLHQIVDTTQSPVERCFVLGPIQIVCQHVELANSGKQIVASGLFCFGSHPQIVQLVFAPRAPSLRRGLSHARTAGERSNTMVDDGQQTHADIPEIPEGVALPDSSGSLIPDAGETEPEDYSDVQIDPETEEVI